MHFLYAASLISQHKNFFFIKLDFVNYSPDAAYTYLAYQNYPRRKRKNKLSSSHTHINSLVCRLYKEEERKEGKEDENMYER